MSEQVTENFRESSAAPSSSDDNEIGLLDLALVLAENLRILILVPLVAGLAALGVGFLTPPTYTAITRILPPLQQQSTAAAFAAQLGALAGFAGAGGISTPTDKFVALLKSGPVLDAMIERFKLKELWKTQYTVDARRTLEGITRVSAEPKSGILTIEVDDRDPKRAADMANAYVEELRNLLRTLAVTEPEQRRLFFDTQLKQARDNLTKSEIALRASGVSESTLKTTPQSTLEVLARLRAQITAQEIKLASMRTSMTDSNPVFRAALQELAALRTELSKAERSNTIKADGEGAEYIAKYRDFKYHEALFELMAKQYEIARLDEAREGAVIQVLDAAQLPERRSSPKRTLMAVVTTLAVFFAMVLLVSMRQALRNLAKEEGSAEKLGRLRRLLRLRRE